MKIEYTNINNEKREIDFSNEQIVSILQESIDCLPYEIYMCLAIKCSMIQHISGFVNELYFSSCTLRDELYEIAKTKPGFIDSIAWFDENQEVRIECLTELLNKYKALL